MNFIFLSPHFPPNYYHFVTRLHSLGVSVFGIADEPYNRLQSELSSSLVEYYRTENMENYDELLRACGYFTHKYGKIDRIESLNEHWLEHEARLRTDFNVSGIKVNDIPKIKRKSCMKSAFQNAGINFAPGRICRSIGEALKLIQEIGYPIVAKPDIGVGASGTYKINDKHDLELFFEKKTSDDHILEKYIEGQIVTFDGLTDQWGKVVFYTSHVYGCGVMEAVNNNKNVYYYSVRKVPTDLRIAGMKLINEFNVRERFFHFEFFREKNTKDLIAIEVNMRPPGGMTTDMFNFANDIDIYYEWAQIVTLNKFSSNHKRKYYCAYIGRKFNRDYQFTHDQFLDKYGELICFHDELRGVFANAMGDYGYLVRSTTLAEISNMVYFLHAEQPS